MRQQILNGYILHQRPYQEKRAIYRFFSYEYGLVDGVGARGMPLFSSLNLVATGQNSLKSFAQINLGFSLNFSHTPPFWLQLSTGKIQYALFYMNEILCRLLPLENQCIDLWSSYQSTVCCLRALDKDLDLEQQMQLMRLYLRRFESHLFAELGVEIDFCCDGAGQLINPDCRYQYLPETGFVLLEGQSVTDNAKQPIYLGKELIQMRSLLQDSDFSTIHLDKFDRLYRVLIDYLLDYKPLNSRKLWQQSQQYRTK